MNRFFPLALITCCMLLTAEVSIAQDEGSNVNDSIASPNIQLDTISQLNLDSLSIVSDSTKVKKERFKLIKSILDKRYPNPNRAAALSLLLPGAGQIYNKKYWKLPFVYGALGGLGYMVIRNNNRYDRFNVAYLAEVDDDETTINEFGGILSETALLRLRDGFNKKRQQGYIFFFAGWALNSVDAFVDAHLASFDVSEDISMHVNPVGLSIGESTAYGVSLRFTNSSKSVDKPVFQY